MICCTNAVYIFIILFVNFLSSVALTHIAILYIECFNVLYNRAMRMLETIFYSELLFKLISIISLLSHFQTDPGVITSSKTFVSEFSIYFPQWTVLKNVVIFIEQWRLLDSLVYSFPCTYGYCRSIRS